MGMIGPRLLFGVCFLLSLGVIINVLLLQQQAGHGRTVTSGAVERPTSRLRATRASEKAAPRDIAVAARVQPARQLVLAIQRELAQRGYYPGRPDGRLGVSTRAAIMAYEVDHHMPVSADASESVLQAIILGSTATGANDRAPPGREARDLIRLVQHLLKRRGYKDVRKTGTLDTPTRVAIERFQKRNALVPNGRISAALMQRLNEAARNG